MTKQWMSMTAAVLALGGLAANGLAGPLNVVATTPELASLAAAIGGGAARVRTITSGREDPHFLQARPTFMVMARNADLWIRMGMDLEVGWEPVILESARNPRIRVGQPGHFDASAFTAYVLEVPDATATRAMGDVHPGGNPHFMLDPRNARRVAIGLADRMQQLNPAGREDYDAGLTAFLRRLDEAAFGADLVEALGGDRLWAAEADGKLAEWLDAEGAADRLGGWMAAMRGWRGKPVISFHKSWSYLAHRFGFEVVAELEPLPGVPPSPAHLARVVDIATDRGVEIILKEPFYPARPANLVARRSGARVAVVNSYATDASREGYFDWMNAIVNAFSGN